MRNRLRLLCLQFARFVPTTLARLLVSDDLSELSRAVKLEQLVSNTDSKIAVVSAFIGEEYSKTTKPCLESRLAYCERHRYNLFVCRETPQSYRRHPTWLRYVLFLRLFDLGYEQLFWLDADAFITNHDVKLELFFEFMRGSDYPQNLYISVDAAKNLNTGSFFLIKSSAVLLVLEMMWSNEINPYPQWLDNGSFIDLYERYFAFRRAVRVELRDRKFNSYVQDSGAYPNRWEEGDFLVHFAGLREPELSALISQFSRFVPRSKGIITESSWDDLSLFMFMTGLARRQLHTITVTKDGPSGIAIFGPYMPVAAGQYMASWRLVSLDFEGISPGAPLIRLQVVDDLGAVVIAERVLTGRDLISAANAEHLFASMEFESSISLLRCELRLWRLAAVQIVIDRIRLLRLANSLESPRDLT